MQREASRGRRGPGGDDPWALRAARFDRVSREREPEDRSLTSLLSLLSPDDVVIDIGAGTGRHAVPIARRVKRVIAVEPSASMRARLEARLAEERVGNVELIAEPWPLAAATRADVVMASHSLYGIDDAAPFVAAMTAAARRLCILLLGLEAPSDRLSRLRTALDGVPRPRRPAALEALMLLYQQGEEASLSLIEEPPRELVVGDDPEQIDDLCARLDLPQGPEGRRALFDALAVVGEPVGGGRYSLGARRPDALLCWRP